MPLNFVFCSHITQMCEEIGQCLETKIAVKICNKICEKAYINILVAILL